MKTTLNSIDLHSSQVKSGTAVPLSPAVLMLGLLLQVGLFIFLSFVMAGMVVPMP